MVKAILTTFFVFSALHSFGKGDPEVVRVKQLAHKILTTPNEQSAELLKLLAQLKQFDRPHHSSAVREEAGKAISTFLLQNVCRQLPEVCGGSAK